MPSPAVLAIDIGGTKMAAAVVSGEGRILASGRSQTLATRDADALFDSLLVLCERVRAAATIQGSSVGTGLTPRVDDGANSSGAQVRSTHGLAAACVAVGVGCGGPMRYPEGAVSPLNIPAWRDFPLRERLAQHFGTPCIVDNDAKALALGERWMGAGRGSDNLLGMVVSTGVGGGIILDGRLRHGFAGNAGHIGHVIVWPDGPPCGCGARGCLEAVASGTGLARRLIAAIAAGSETTLRAGQSAADIAAAARAGDVVASELLRSAGECTGRGIASAAALLDLELVVIGGSIALKAWDLIGPPLEAELARAARLDFTRNVRVARAALADDAGVLGAARLALDLVDA